MTYFLCPATYKLESVFPLKKSPLKFFKLIPFYDIRYHLWVNFEGGTFSVKKYWCLLSQSFEEMFQLFLMNSYKIEPAIQHSYAQIKPQFRIKWNILHLLFIKAVTKLHVSNSISVENEVRSERFKGGTSSFSKYGSFTWNQIFHRYSISLQ